MVWFILAIVAAALFTLAIVQRKQKHNKRLEAIRANWGCYADQNYDPSQVGAYFKNLQQENSVSENIAHDLDLDKVFASANHTVSKPGQQYLYARLRSAAKTTSELHQLEELSHKLTDDANQREKVQSELARLDNRNAYNLQELFTKSHKPLYTPLTALYIQFAWVLWIGTLILTIALHNQFLFMLALGLTLFNCYLHFTNKNKINRYVHSLPQLKLLIDVVSKVTRMIDLPINQSAGEALEKVQGIKHRLGLVSMEGQLVNDPTDLAYGIWELVKMLLLIEPRMFINSLSGVSTQREFIGRLFEYAGRVDMAIAIASYRLSLPYYCKPEFTNSDTLNFTDVYHPLVEDCVPNSLQVRADQGVLITGSNMSGKTTFIRAVAINTLLAQTINTTCATRFQLPLLQICTSIRVSDDVEEHRSYFQAEALSVLDIMKKAESVKSLVIIDEIFRGTNTIERVAAAKSILSYLVANRNFVFISTHDLELAELLGTEYAVYSFEEMMADKRLVFDYKIKPGILKNKNAIAILEAMGYPESVVMDAYKMSEQLREKYKAD